MAISCKIKIIQAKQLTRVMQESLIPHDMFHTENALAILYMALYFFQLDYCISC